MRVMNLTRILSTLLGTALLSLALFAGPALAVDPAPVADGVELLAQDAELAVEGETTRRELADSPRNRMGLLLYGALFAGAWFAWVGMRRQLKGEHPKASGEFRWR